MHHIVTAQQLINIRMWSRPSSLSIQNRHPLLQCSKFRQATCRECKAVVMRNNLSYNCLKNGHRAFQCNSITCHTYGKWHHTLLHAESQWTQDAPSKECTGDMQHKHNGKHPSTTSSYCSLKTSPGKQVLLATPRIRFWVAVMLHIGNMCTMPQTSKLARQNTDSRNRCNLLRYKTPCLYTSGLLCKGLCHLSITDTLPEQIIDPSTWHLPHVQHTDPEFWSPEKIDVSLGAEFCPYSHKSRSISVGADHPVLQEKELGWLISGQYLTVEHNISSRQPVVSCFIKTKMEVQMLLKKFWEIEELNHDVMMKEEEQREAHFVQHTKKDSAGRFIVHLPFRQEPSKLGGSFNTAAKRFSQVEQTLARHLKLKESYTQFIREYEGLEPMEPVATHAAISYYMQHHVVLKEANSSTKTQVVFDCLAKTSSNLPLNSLLMVGPTIQSDLCSIILHFHMHRIAFMADREKMYRQVLVADEDRAYQRILWRSKTSAPLQEYQLKTVTYRMACTCFLAVRCLSQLAHEEGRCNKAANILANDFYVDDCISGCDTVETEIKVQQGVAKLLKKDRFSLRKWSSNSMEFFENIPSVLRETQVPLRLDNNKDIKALGLLWHPAADQFQIVNNVKPACKVHSFTKPILQLIWDEPLPQELNCMWQTLYRECFRIAQEDTYATAIHQLKTIKLVDKNGKLKSPHPILIDMRLLQLVGDLPRPRVEAVRPFFNCGFDCTGQFYVKAGSQRSKLKEKCSVALFLCLATRAVLWSRYQQTQVESFMHKEATDWHFVPPASPNFGGVWEAGVKSFNYHSQRMMGSVCPTFKKADNPDLPD
ncbi:uncharacterized protein LOC124787372 [Schistocerca piceifrons]|uniref:uncharacterized protein LOC124787372 n=1 Tax=Schistocerca piceifrons TaxID=274613 RepID=UPI001F5FEE85|nr:uncharacterized protein LOC124787372 [Schistocerca piceifrons]